MSLKYDIYLDTSVINFPFADDAPEKKMITVDFFDNFVKKESYNTFISPFVIEEINNTDDEEKRNKLLHVFEFYPIQLLDVNNEDIISLSTKYIASGSCHQKKSLMHCM